VPHKYPFVTPYMLIKVQDDNHLEGFKCLPQRMNEMKLIGKSGTPKGLCVCIESIVIRINHQVHHQNLNNNIFTKVSAPMTERNSRTAQPPHKIIYENSQRNFGYVGHSLVKCDTTFEFAHYAMKGSLSF
jgi:hypothetical protein